MASEQNERERQLEAFQKQVGESSQLESLQSSDNWQIVDKVLDDLTIQYSNAILNGDPADHDTYLVNRAKLDGVRSVRLRFNTIIQTGKQASDAIDTITG